MKKYDPHQDEGRLFIFLLFLHRHLPFHLFFCEEGRDRRETGEREIGEKSDTV
jgi:hypothetical protein